MKAAHRFAGLGAVLLLAACHANRPVAGIAERNLPARGAERLMDGLTAHLLPAPRYYSAKAEVEMKNAQGSKSFKARVRCVRDSALWISVVPALGIEVARILLTRDSLKLLDRLHNTYWVGDTAAARLKFGISPALGLFQDALAGRPAGLDPHEKYRSDREGGHYVLTSKERRKFIRAAENLAPDSSVADGRDMGGRKLQRTLRKAERREAMVYKYWIEPDSMRVDRVTIIDLAHGQRADVNYLERTSVAGRAMPSLLSLSLSAPGQETSGTLKLSRIELNGPLQLNFRIPEKFRPME